MPSQVQKRWTIPQVAVWIRYRDLRRVLSLTGRARKFISALEDIEPETRKAVECLRAGLRDGRLVLRDGDGKAIEVGAVLKKGPLFFESKSGVGARTGPSYKNNPRATCFSNVVIDPTECRKAWPEPESILGAEPLALEVVLDQLGEDIRPALASLASRWFLCLPSVLVKGRQDGKRDEVDQQALLRGEIRRLGDSIATRHQDERWTSVTVELCAPSKPSAYSDSIDRIEHAPPRRPGRKPELRNRIVCHWRENYKEHGGVPPEDIKKAVLQSELAEAGIKADLRTIGRALGRK